MNEYQRIAASMLKFRKANWDKARSADPEQMQAWAAIFQAARVSYPEIVWQHAMLHLGKIMDEPPTAKDVLAACRHVTATAGVGSEVYNALQLHRSARLSAREAKGELPPGTTFSGQQTATQRVSGPTQAQRTAIKQAVKKAREKRLAREGHATTPQEALTRLDKLVEHYANKQPKET